MGGRMWQDTGGSCLSHIYRNKWGHGIGWRIGVNCRLGAVAGAAGAAGQEQQ